MAQSRSTRTTAGDDLVIPVQAARPRDVAAFETVYRAHYRDVYRYILATTRASAEAEDVVSETFARAYAAWTTVPEPALPWLLLTARRITTDRWRRLRTLAGIGGRLRPTSPTDAGERATEFWLWFDAVSRVLTDRQREVLVLRYQRDLTDADIARIMSLSESGVRSLTARALDALRQHPELLR